MPPSARSGIRTATSASSTRTSSSDPELIGVGVGVGGRGSAAVGWRRRRRVAILWPMRVLIVEDDPELAALLRDGLREQRIDPTVAVGFGDGREQALVGDYDVIILDV